jgi:hypothetical protein
MHEEKVMKNYFHANSFHFPSSADEWVNMFCARKPQRQDSEERKLLLSLLRSPHRRCKLMGKNKFSSCRTRKKLCVGKKVFRRPLAIFSAKHISSRREKERNILSIFFYLYECLCRTITLIYFMHLRWLVYDAERASRSIFRIQETQKRAGEGDKQASRLFLLLSAGDGNKASA